jgi:hypothetical protein
LTFRHATSRRVWKSEGRSLLCYEEFLRAAGRKNQSNALGQNTQRTPKGITSNIRTDIDCKVKDLVRILSVDKMVIVHFRDALVPFAGGHAAGEPPHFLHENE